MKYDPQHHHRRSIRVPGYDYAQPGAYFITIVTQDRVCLFGDVVEGEMQLNAYGQIVHDQWRQTAVMRPNVALDAFVIMPNHIHGIIVLHECDCRGTLQRAPTLGLQRATGQIERFGKPTSGSIPTIVRLFKSATTKRINETRGTPSAPVWQRNYYEHIIRNDSELARIRQYILDNPATWMQDREYPNRDGIAWRQ